MAKITFSLTNAAGTASIESPELSADHEAKLIDWMWSAYPQMSDPDPETGEQTELPKTNANIAECFRDWGRAIWAGTKANELRYRKDVAGNAAEDAETGIG